MHGRRPRRVAADEIGAATVRPACDCATHRADAGFSHDRMRTVESHSRTATPRCTNRGDSRCAGGRRSGGGHGWHTPWVVPSDKDRTSFVGSVAEFAAEAIIASVVPARRAASVNRSMRFAQSSSLRHTRLSTRTASLHPLLGLSLPRCVVIVNPSEMTLSLRNRGAHRASGESRARRHTKAPGRRREAA